MQDISKFGEYGSPRISREVLDCGLPLTFDQYSICGFNCCYCFSQYIRGVGPARKDYDARVLKIVRPEKIKEIFLLKRKRDYSDFIKKRYMMQWGGLSDPFCPLEKIYGVGLELMKFFNEIKYPISFSSKGDLPISDERYFNEFKKAGSRWHYKASIITLDKEKARKVERGTPSPERRFEVLKRLSEVGVKTTLRMRPIVIGLTDKDFEPLIAKAKESGCSSVSAEFFCYDERASNRRQTMEAYKVMGEVVGYNITQFYKQFRGDWVGYIRLSYELKKHYADILNEICAKYEMPIAWSDSDLKHMGQMGCCCGIKEEWGKCSKMQYTNLILEAKKKGYITFEDVMEMGKEEKQWREEAKIEGYMNLGGGNSRNKKRKMSYWDFFLKSWNDIKSGLNPVKAYGKSLRFRGRDKNGNAIYFYNYQKDR